MKIKAAYLLILLFFVLTACKKQDQGTPGVNEIWFVYKAYNPAQLSVPVGTTVTFINKDNATHSATSTTGLFDSGSVKSGDSYTYKFTAAGTYYFYCNYHSSNAAEQGAIRVQ
jgi:plastocyanin